MSVILSPKNTSQTFLNDQEYTKLKNNLGELIVKNINRLMLESASFKENNKPSLKLNGRTFPIQITNPTTNKIDNWDFYPDQFISKVVPADLKDLLGGMGVTDRAAHKVFVNACINLFRSMPKYHSLKENLKKTEKIKTIEESSVIKTVAYQVLDENVWRISSREHLCDDQFIANWV